MIAATAIDQTGGADAAPRGPYRSKGSAQTLFQRVTALVRSERVQLYGPWFVMAATESEYGTTARSLRRLGVDPDALARAARAELDALRG